MEPDIGKFYLDNVAEYFAEYQQEYAIKVADATYIALTISIAEYSSDALALEHLQRLRKLAAAYTEYKSKLEAGDYDARGTN